MQVLKLKKQTDNNMDIVITIVTIYCYVKNIKINRTELTILAYFIKYGIKKSTKDIILRSKILECAGSLENTLSKLRKLGLVIEDKEGLSIVNPEIQFTPDNKMGIIIKLENI